MLSCRYSYHAGDFADVLKHIVMVEILQYFGLENSALAYIDTHTGAALVAHEAGRLNLAGPIR